MGQLIVYPKKKKNEHFELQQHVWNLHLPTLLPVHVMRVTNILKEWVWSNRLATQQSHYILAVSNLAI